MRHPSRWQPRWNQIYSPADRVEQRQPHSNSPAIHRQASSVARSKIWYPRICHADQHQWSFKRLYVPRLLLQNFFKAFWPYQPAVPLHPPDQRRYLSQLRGLRQVWKRQQAVYQRFLTLFGWQLPRQAYFIHARSFSVDGAFSHR